MVLLEQRVKADLVEAYKAHLRAILVRTRSFDGCEALTVYQDTTDAARFTLVEQWRSRDAYERYVRWRADAGDLDVLRTFLAEPSTVTFHDDLDV
jgi:quinol monooxygenase YgiN